MRDILRLAGKSGGKVCAVFATSSDGAERAVRHLRKGADGLPVWLFSTVEVDAETAAVCERVWVIEDSLALLVEAEKALWPHWVALSAATWTGGHGRWGAKLAPFLVPPFRALILNEHGDFFDATAGAALRHARRRLRDAAHSAWHGARDLHRGLWLWAFALAAQRAAWLSRWAFRRVTRGGKSAPVQWRSGGRDHSVSVFQYQARYWDWGELRRFLEGAHTRFVLFQTSGGDYGGMLPLFDDPRVFAVSRQPDFRDWKPSLFATAPFRRLQAGEASRTFAPVSDFLLVDRAKLLALGAPKTIVPGTAWLLLFWRAAAAGWISYSVGREEAVGYTPDWPYEEAEFVTRVLADPELRRLAPVEPELARGNIAFAIGKAKAAEKRTVLVVSPYLPFPLSHGGAVRIYNLCKALAPRVDFLLASFREKDERVHYDELHEVFREVYAVDRDERASREASAPKQVREHTSRSMRALIADLAPRADLLQVEFTHLAHFRDAAPRTPAILVEHDLTFTLYRQFAERNPGRAAREEYERWHAFERSWMARYDAVWTMSEEDRALASAEGARAVAVANGVDVARFTAAAPAEGQEILYVGSFRHRPNVIGFEKLRAETMPLVWRKFPRARLSVVSGPDAARYHQPGELDPRIELHGFVADLRPLYARAAVVAVPLEVSAGTNIKVMEAMACGRTVVSTAVGCQGLGLVDGRDIVVREGAGEFAEAVCGLLADRGRRDSIARAARRTVEERFRWEAIAEEAWESYRRLLAAPQ